MVDWRRGARVCPETYLVSRDICCDMGGPSGKYAAQCSYILNLFGVVVSRDL